METKNIHKRNSGTWRVLQNGDSKKLYFVNWIICEVIERIPILLLTRFKFYFISMENTFFWYFLRIFIDRSCNFYYLISESLLHKKLWKENNVKLLNYVGFTYFSLGESWNKNYFSSSFTDKLSY